MPILLKLALYIDKIDYPLARISVFCPLYIPPVNLVNLINMWKCYEKR